MWGFLLPLELIFCITAAEVMSRENTYSIVTIGNDKTRGLGLQMARNCFQSIGGYPEAGYYWPSTRRCQFLQAGDPDLTRISGNQDTCSNSGPLEGTPGETKVFFVQGASNFHNETVTNFNLKGLHCFTARWYLLLLCKCHEFCLRLHEYLKCI